MAENLDMISLRLNQQVQVLEQYRASMYNSDLRMELLMKMLVEKGLFAKDEFDKRWPLFLKNDIGAVGPDGVMEGTCKIHFYGMS